MPESNASPGARGGGGDSANGCSGRPPEIDPSRITLNNNSLYTLISWAYNLNCRDADAVDLISGGPAWVRSDKWVIQAIIPAAAAVQVPAGGPLLPFTGSPISDLNLQKMLQNLLADRFKLVLHRETKEASIYELTAAKGGPKLERQCLPPEPRKPGERTLPGMHLCISIEDFTAVLQEMLERPVVNKTGLTGMFLFRLMFDPREGGVSDPAKFGPLPEPAGPSIFTALQEQLGLRLVSTKGPVEVIVIDSVQKPVN